MKRLRSSSLLLELAPFVLTIGTVVTGYAALGVLPAFLFTFGFVGGTAAWIATKERPAFERIRQPFYATLFMFVIHKLEERHNDFFTALSAITGVTAPKPGTWVTLVLYGVAAMWLFVPYLVGRRHEFGYYLAWTFFTSMGVIELSHFVFPLMVRGPYAYFPGMASVFLLAPLGWWGMYRLCRN